MAQTPHVPFIQLPASSGRHQLIWKDASQSAFTRSARSQGYFSRCSLCSHGELSAGSFHLKASRSHRGENIVKSVSATTQQSRFHSATLQQVCEDVDLKQLTLTVEDRELLSSADLRLFAGVHYGLIGANGVGKSTLLRALGEGLVVGFPSNLHALYVDQLQGTSSTGSVLELVMDADKDVVMWRKQAALLQDGMDKEGEDELVRAVKLVKTQELRTRVAEAALTNELRSGERGKQAQVALLELEAKLKAAEESSQNEATARERQAAPRIGQELLESLMGNLQLAGANAAEARARKLLRGLGFSPVRQDQPISVLSGGWRVRAALAQALFLEPDILLLDEPTNFLDLPSILWLQAYLGSLDKTIVVVSHDRAFLDAVAQEIILFRDNALTYHKGNYSEFRQNADEKRQYKLRLQEGIEKKKARVEKSIQENLSTAKKAGDDKKLKQVASKQRKLEERMGMEKNDKGHRFRRQRDMVGFHNTTRRDVEVEELESTPSWKLPEPPPMRSSGPLVQIEDVSFSYPHPGSPKDHGSRGAARKAVIKNTTLCIEQGSRIALVGANGKGKSTLVNLAVGELEPTSGSVTRHPQARIGRFAQHQVEDLVIGKSQSSALSYMKELFPDAKDQELRKHLGAFGISAGLATQMLQALSGGQAVRVQLAAIAYGSPHLLVLDEPSSHLDMPSIDALTACLLAFSGAVLLVSHDQHLVSSVARQVYLVDDGSIRLLELGVMDYIKELQRKQRKSS